MTDYEAEELEEIRRTSELGDYGPVAAHVAEVTIAAFVEARELVERIVDFVDPDATAPTHLDKRKWLQHARTLLAHTTLEGVRGQRA